MLKKIPSDFKSTTKKIILTALYKEPRDKIKLERIELLKETIRLAQVPMNGRFHITTPTCTIGKALGTSIVHYYFTLPSHLENIDVEISERETDLLMEKILVEGYLRRLFNLIETMGDVKKVFPDTLYDILPLPRKTQIYNSASVLSYFKIDIFNREEQKNIELVKERFLINLLLR